MLRWWLMVTAMAILPAAHAESSITVGSTGKLSASASINIKVVIPPVLGLNDQARIISNGGPRDIVVRSLSYEGFTEFAGADWGFLPVSMNYYDSQPRPRALIPIQVLTVSKP